MTRRLFIGWDPAELRAWNVARSSAEVVTSTRLEVRRVALQELRQRRLYTRPTEQTEHGYWDEISAAPMSTGHAIARFLVPTLCDYRGWALFTDGDVLFRRDLEELFALADPRYAVQVVQHEHVPSESVKMTGHAQTQYRRKNWSSVMLLNCGHPANRALTADLVNTVPGRDLHRFCWLPDDLVGALPQVWNVLIGHSPDAGDAAIVHFTSGLPDMPGYEHVPYADEWYHRAHRCGYRLQRPPAPAARISA